MLYIDLDRLEWPKFLIAVLGKREFFSSSTIPNGAGTEFRSNFHY